MDNPNASFSRVIVALGVALAAAPVPERSLLVEAIEDYVTRFPDAFRNIQNGDAARVLRELFDEVIEAVDARPV